MYTAFKKLDVLRLGASSERGQTFTVQYFEESLWKPIVLLDQCDRRLGRLVLKALALALTGRERTEDKVLF